jgi:hypothetical protein
MGYSRKQLEDLNRKVRLEGERNRQRSVQEQMRHEEMIANMKRLRELRLARGATELESNCHQHLKGRAGLGDR